jgi:hypothetical protein
MRHFVRCVGTSLFTVLTLIFLCSGQTGSGVQGHVFRSDTIGLTYTFPDRFHAKVEREMPQDPSGREHVILALWDKPSREGVPRMAFLYDTKVRPVGSTREIMAARYLDAMKHQAQNGQGVNISEPKKISPAGYAIWRLDYLYPAAPEREYNSGIVIPLKDRRILAIQINASSQADLDSEVDSLRNLAFDGKGKPK